MTLPTLTESLRRITAEAIEEAKMAQEITLTGQEIYNLTHAWLELMGKSNPEMARKIEPLIGYAEKAPRSNFKIIAFKESETP